MNSVFKIVFLLFVLHVVGNNGNIIRMGEDVSSKEILVWKEDDNINQDSDIPADVAAALSPDNTNRDCVPVGSFCMNHSDCCSNACLGYMKRCVSGSG